LIFSRFCNLQVAPILHAKILYKSSLHNSLQKLSTKLSTKYLSFWPN